MSEQKIKYIELKPLQREIIFNNTQEWVAFFNEYYQKIIDYSWDRKMSIEEYYSFKRHKLNKNGMIRKSFEPKHLMTPEARAKQKVKFAEYCKRRKKETQKRRVIREITDCKMKIDYQQQILKELEVELKKYE